MKGLRVTEQFIEGLARCRRVRRYALEATLQNQNVADHSYGASMMAWYIVNWIRIEGYDEELSREFTAELAAVYMLMHDYPEHLTGDLNYFVKKHSGKDFLDSWDDMEVRRFIEWFSPNGVETRTEEVLREVLEMSTYPPLKDVEKAILKIADYSEFLLYCVEELRLGNKYAIDMIKAGVDIIYELALSNSCGFLLNENSPVKAVLDRAGEEIRQHER